MTKISPIQKTILSTTKTKATAASIAETVKSKPGPVARACNSLVQSGFMQSKTTKDGAIVYSRTAAGTKLLKILP